MRSKKLSGVKHLVFQLLGEVSSYQGSPTPVNSRPGEVEDQARQEKTERKRDKKRGRELREGREGERL